MTAWIYLGLVLAACGGMLTTYIKGVEAGKQEVRSLWMAQELGEMKAVAAVDRAVAKHIQSIKVENKTYIRNFKEIERENTVYRDCQHTDDAFRLLNSALSGDPLRTQPTVPGQLSE